jgi:glycosyltransferase involved in cell wall biosynthesis
MIENMKNNSKIKVLVVPSDRTGVGYFRSTNPHISLETNYPEEFHIDIDYSPQLNNDEWLKQYDIIHYHRTLGAYENMERLIPHLKSLGIVTVMDLDDYWSPGSHHPAYLIIKQHELDKKILNNIKVSENVMTTTPLFAEEISKYNENVFVIPNAIDPTEKQHTPNPESSERIRIGWLGGSSHLEDLKLLKGLSNRLKGDGLIDKVQMVLCGFDTRGTKTIINKDTGENKRVPITPMESVWFQYEKIFTDDYKIVSEEYKKHLLTFTKEEFPGIENEPYRRVWTKPINTYSTNYNLFDISLAPLTDNTFNKVKSQLKVIEAGFHKKAIIAQNFGPYQVDLKHAFDKPLKGQEAIMNDGNALLINNFNSNKSGKDWFKAVKKLINNPELVTELSDRLHQTVKDSYSMNAVTSIRRDLYRKLINNNTVEITEKVASGVEK